MQTMPDTLPHPAPLLLPLDLLAAAALMLLLCLVAWLEPSPGLSALALVAWCLAIARLFARRPAGMVLLTPFLLIQSSVMLSLLAIEGGAHMKEMGTTGAPSMAGVLYPLVSLLFVLSALASHGFWQGRHAGHTVPPAASRPFWLAQSALGTVLLVDVVLLLNGLAGGFPLLTGTDRFQYRANAGVLALNLLNLKVVIAALCGCGAVAAGNLAGRRRHHVAFGTYLLLSFLFGDKFFNIFVASLVYAMPGALIDPRRFLQSAGRWMPMAGAVVVAVLAATGYTYSGQGELGLAQTLERLGDRVAGQGQLWWLAVRDNGQWWALDTRAVRGNLASLLATPAAEYVFTHRLAAFHFVERYAPAAMYLSFQHNGGMVTPTMLFEAYALVVLGGAGLVLATVAAGLFTGSVLHWLHCRLLQGDMFAVLLPAYVFTQTFYLMAQATLYNLAGISAMKAYLAMGTLQWAVSTWLAVTRQAAVPGHPRSMLP